MTGAAITAFRDRVNKDPSLQPGFAEALAAGPDAAARFAQAHGYDISPAEARDAVEQLAHGSELSDYELELVAGGGNPPTNTPESTGSAKSM